MPALDRAGMLRQPAGVTFGEVAVAWHVQQNDRPLVSSRGHLSDHFALGVADLNAWIAKLRREGVIFSTKPYNLGTQRAVMIEDPSREAIELVETSTPGRAHWHKIVESVCDGPGSADGQLAVALRAIEPKSDGTSYDKLVEPDESGRG